MFLQNKRTTYNVFKNMNYTDIEDCKTYIRTTYTPNLSTTSSPHKPENDQTMSQDSVDLLIKKKVCRKLFTEDDYFVQKVAEHLNSLSEKKDEDMDMDKQLIEDLHIIGMYQTVNNINKNNEKEDGFFILSQKENMTNHLKKTKFCQYMIKNGTCDRKVCNFAHSVKEYHHPTCAFHSHCTKIGCEFKHPYETDEEYEKRIHFKIPNNIK